MRTSTMVMGAFAVLFGLLAVFLAQTWLNNQAEQRMKSLEAQKKSVPPAHTIVVASRPLRFGDTLGALSLREVPWPENALPAGVFAKIGELTSGKRVVLMPIDENEAILASKITGPGQRATLSAMLHDGMKAVTIRVNDVEGVAGFVLPGDHVDVVLTRQRDKESATNDVVIQNAGVLAIDQLADARAEKPSVVKAVTLEVDETDGQKLALASAVGTLSLVLGKAGEAAQDSPRQVSLKDLGSAVAPSSDARFITIGVTREFKRQDYTVRVDGGDNRSAAIPGEELVAVVLGGHSASQRDADMRELISAHLKEAALRRAAPAVAEKAEQGGEPQPVPLAKTPLSSRLDPAPTASANNRPAAGSNDPIQPVLVKTISYRTAPVQTASLAPMPTLVPVAAPSPQPAAAPVVHTPPASQSLAAPSTIVVASTEPASIVVSARTEAARSDLAKPHPAMPQTRAHGGWLIQIGAFEGEDEAKQHLSAAQLKAPAMLAAADAFTERVQKGDKTLYRARFASFDKATAEAACKQLKRSDVDCIAVRN